MSWTVSIVLRTDASKAAAKSFSDPSGLDCAKMKTELSRNATIEAVNAFFITILFPVALVFRDALNTNAGSRMFWTLGRPFRNESSKDMAFPHPKSRQDMYAVRSFGHCTPSHKLLIIFTLTDLLSPSRVPQKSFSGR